MNSFIKFFLFCFFSVLAEEPVVLVLVPVERILINNDLDIELNKKRRDTRLIARRFEDILSSLSSDSKNSVLKFKGVNIQYVNLNVITLVIR